MIFKIKDHINSKNTALIVVDMQNDFILSGSILEVKDIKHSLDVCNNFIHLLREKGVLILYTKHIYHPDENIIESQLFPNMAENGLREGMPGSDIIYNIQPTTKDIIIEKRRYDAFFETDLENILRKNNIQNVIIIGTMTNICCESTARSAMMRDFFVLFCSDLSFTHNSSVQKITLNNIASHFGWVLTSEEILKYIH